MRAVRQQLAQLLELVGDPGIVGVLGGKDCRDRDDGAGGSAWLLTRDDEGAGSDGAESSGSSEEVKECNDPLGPSVKELNEIDSRLDVVSTLVDFQSVLATRRLPTTQ